MGKKEVHAPLHFGKAVNTGIVGWTKDASILPEWDRVTVLGCEKNCTLRIVDEIGCQVILHKHKHHLLDHHWNTSVKHGKQDDPIIIHYHGYKHTHPYPICEHWKKAFWQTVLFTKHGHNALEASGDKRLRRYLAEVEKKDITIVTAVNRKYADKFIDNYNAWRETPGLREQNFLIFYHPDCIDYIKSHPKWKHPPGKIKTYQRTRMVEWSLPAANGNIREEMLSAFILGTAKEAKTKYWMKLDGDCSPVAPFEWPDYQSYGICAHGWGFTKQKGDPDTSRHWLNRLDDWAEPFTGKRIFPKIYDPINEKRVRHKRFCSFCYIEETRLSKEVASKCNGRLPIPSQDTTMWYYATVMGEPVLLTNFKQYLKP